MSTLDEQQKSSPSNELWQNTLGRPLPEDKGRSWWARSMTSVEGEPLPYLSRPSYNAFRVTSGLGVLLITLIAWLIGSVSIIAPLFWHTSSWLWPFAAIFLPLAIYWDYQAIRRIRWEHTHGGIFKRAISDLVACGIAGVLFIVANILSRLSGGN